MTYITQGIRERGNKVGVKRSWPIQKLLIKTHKGQTLPRISKKKTTKDAINSCTYTTPIFITISPGVSSGFQLCLPVEGSHQPSLSIDWQSPWTSSGGALKPGRRWDPVQDPWSLPLPSSKQKFEASLKKIKQKKLKF